MKKYIIATMFLLLCLGANAQFNISYAVGYGGYKMNEMKQLLETAFNTVVTTMPVGTRIVDNFPPYITHNLDLSYKFNRHELGLKSSFLTTGGKIAYSDYSGKYVEKLTLNGYRVGAMYRINFGESKFDACTWSFFGELSPAITFTKLKYKATLDIYDPKVHQTAPDNVSTNETGLSLQPLVGSKLSLTRTISFFVSLGYDFEFGSKLATTNDMYRADWSGFRLNGGTTFSF